MGEHEGAGGARSGEDPDVGSLGEETAKLLGALSHWAREQGASTAGATADLAGGLAHAVEDVNEHIATGSEECRYCPVCQVIHLVRSTSPEVREHLTSAATSLLAAAAGALATRQEGGRPRGSGTGVEHIDLDGDGEERS